MIKRKEEYREEIWEEPYGGQGEISVVQMIDLENHGNPRFQMVSRVTAAPGVKVGRHNHLGKTEMLYILAGRCGYDDGESHILLPGDSAIVRGEDSHCLESLGPEALEYLATIVLD